MDELTTLFGSLITLISFETVFLILLFLKTPALKFFKASFRHNHILYHPKENRYVEFIPSKMFGSLAYSKGRGYYVINPKDTYIEVSSKVPVTAVYGNAGRSLDLKMAGLADRVKEMGLRNYDDLVKLRNALAANNQSLTINIAGESVDLAAAIDYFNTSERSDLTEAEIQRRTSAQVMAKLGERKDIMKWAAFILLVLIGAAIAYAIIMQVVPSGGGIVNPIVSSVQQVTGGVSVS